MKNYMRQIMAKSVKKAYILWLCGGLFGLHHIYLGRDKQAVIWFATLGGFLVGLVRDLFKMPEYVKEANFDADYLRALDKRRRRLLAPSFFFFRFLSSIGVSWLYGYFMLNCIPTELDSSPQMISLVKLTYPLVVALLVQLAGTEIPVKGRFRWSLLGSYLGFVINVGLNTNHVYISSILSALFLNWNAEWDKKYILERKKSSRLVKRVVRLSFYAVLIVSLTSLFVWNYGSLDVDGKKVTIKDSIKNFLNSKELNQLFEGVRVLWNFYQAHGFVKLKNQLFYGYDPAEIAKAYATIELTERATQKELDDKCRALSRKWHPDKYKVSKSFKKFSNEKALIDKFSFFF